MLNSTKKTKLSILIILLIVIGFVGYYLFVPEYKKSTSIDNAYVYVKDGCLKKRYTINYDDEFTLNIKSSNFSIILPYNHTITYDWKLVSEPADSILLNSYVKKCRTPVYDRHKEGTDYSIKIFEFKNEKLSNEKLVFEYFSTVDSDSKERNKIILNTKHE